MLVADRFILAGFVILLTGLWLLQSLWSERVYSWYRQPDEFWFSAVAIIFAALAGAGILAWGVLHSLI
jgi:hypothetical protein